MVERDLAKVEVAGSSPVIRSRSGHEVKIHRVRNFIRRHSQVVRQRSAKPLFPGSNPGGASKRKTHPIGCVFLLDVLCTRDPTALARRFTSESEAKTIENCFRDALHRKARSRRSRIGERLRLCDRCVVAPPKKFRKRMLSEFFYPSRRLGISSPREVRCISSALRAVYHHASACILLRLDDIQSVPL